MSEEAYTPDKYGRNLLKYQRSKQGMIKTEDGDLFEYEKREDTEDGYLSEREELEDGWYFRRRKMNARWFKVCDADKDEHEARQIFKGERIA